jgi:hypothetical protein
LMAGAGYKLFNTGDVLTAAQVNTYLQEQTVMVFANSTARTTALSGVLAEGMMSYLQDTNAVEVYNGSSWVNVGNAGDITEVQAGVGISIASGTGPIPVITNSSTDLITTAGDLLYGTAADTMARLGIGTAGQVLKVNSGATAPEWGSASGGGGMTLLETLTLSGSSTTSSSIAGTYKHLLLVFKNIYASTGTDMTLRFNGDSGTNYLSGRVMLTNSTVSARFNAPESKVYLIDADTQTGALQKTTGAIWVYRYADTDQTFFAGNLMMQTASDRRSFRPDGIYDQSAAISTVTIGLDSGTFSAGTLYIYGVE